MGVAKGVGGRESAFLLWLGFPSTDVAGIRCGKAAKQGRMGRAYFQCAGNLTYWFPPRAFFVLVAVS